MLYVFAEPDRAGNIGNVRPERTLQRHIFSEMMAIDYDRAIVTMQAWTKFIQLAYTGKVPTKQNN
jgi:hypothetical protein